MLRRRLLVPLAFLLSGFPIAAFAQTPDQAATAAPTQTPPASLKTVMETLSPPANTLVLAVAAEKTLLPKSAPPLRERPTLTQVADAFQRTTRRFGAVTAIAPPTMVLLNANPGAPNIYADMPAQDVMKLLAASLSRSQWQALVGNQGLGLPDMENEQQKMLFLALFPEGKMTVVPERSILQRAQPGEMPSQGASPRDLSAEIPQVRLRLRQVTRVMIPATKGNSWYNIFESPQNLKQNPQYQILGITRNADTLYGVQMRAIAPNKPKPGDLNLEHASLNVTVSLEGVRTVGDLVARVAQATRIELYADRRYEGRSLTVQGTSSASAGDLLRSLTFCLTGTFRKVGPAYVLTDDRIGAGTRRLILQEFERDAETLRKVPLDQAGDKLVNEHQLNEIPWGEGAQALTAEQIAKANEEQRYLAGRRGSYSIQMPLNELTPAQQQEARRKFASYQENRALYTWIEPDVALSLSGKIMIDVYPQLEVLIPSLPAPLRLASAESLGNLLEPSAKLRDQLMKEDRERRLKEQAQKPPAATQKPPQKPPSPPLPSYLQVITSLPARRAVLAQPTTPAEVESLVASMKALKLTQLWLCLSPQNAPDPTELLDKAIAAAKGSDIVIFPALDLYLWNQPVSPEAQDLTLLGENSTQVEERRQRRSENITARSIESVPPTKETRSVVSPFSEQVQEILLQLLKKLNSRPEVAGLVWRSSAPSGYVPRFGYAEEAAFGYHEAARLAFLRREHVDPVDVGQVIYSRADTVLPEFDASQDQDMTTRWQTFRDEENRARLQRLRDTLPTRSGSKPVVFIEQLNTSRWDSWFGSWEGQAAPLPAYREFKPDGSPLRSQSAAVEQAKAQSRLSLMPIRLWPGLPAQSLAAELSQRLKKEPWDGFVLDLTKNSGQMGLPGADAQSSIEALAAMAKTVNTPPPTPTASVP